MSSRQNAELNPYRDWAASELELDPFAALFCIWRFEDQPASARPPEEVYLEGVSSSDVILFIAGSDTSDATAAEVARAISEGTDILCLILPFEARTDRVTELISRVRELGTTKDVAAEEQPFRFAVRQAAQGWLAHRITAGPTQNRRSRLRALRNDSHEKMVQSWLSAGIDEELAREFAADPTIGKPPFDASAAASSRFHVLVGPAGSGKSLAVERLFQNAISNAESEVLSPVPVRLMAYNIVGSLAATIDTAMNGLGVLSLNGVSLFVDALDEVDQTRASQIYEEAWVIRGTNPRSQVVLASRHSPPTHLSKHVIHIDPLSPAHAQLLVQRVGGDVATMALRSKSGTVLEIYRRPLFALILSQSSSQLPDSESALADFLIAKSLTRTERVAATGAALLRLAKGILDSPEAGVALESFPVSEQIELLKSRLVLEDQGKFRIPLRLVAERASSQWLLQQPLSVVIEKTRATGLADRWKLPLIDYVRQLSDEDAANFVREVVVYDPVLAISLAEADVGEREEAWTASSLQADLDASELAFSEAFSQLYAQHVETTEVENIDGEDLTIRRRTMAGDGQLEHTTTYSGRGHIDSRRHSPFLFAKKHVIELIDDLLATRGFSVYDESLWQEDLWNQARALIGQGTQRHEALSLTEVAERLAILPRGLVMAYDSGATYVAVNTDELSRYVSERQGIGDTHWSPPFVPADRRADKRVWSVYSHEALLRKRRDVLSKAMGAYVSIVDHWLPAISQRLSKRMIRPAVIREWITFAADGRPLRSGYWLALAPGSEDLVDVTLGDQPDLNPTMDAALKEQRHEGHSTTQISTGSGTIEMWGPWPTRETVYRWLFEDLRALRLTRYLGLP